MTAMTLFKPAEVTSAFLKMGLMGFAGSGKTRTSTDTAIGLITHMRELSLPQGNKPLFFIDTETGSDWMKPRIEAAGISMMTAKTRAFSDLLLAVKEAEANASVLLADSITHFWVELCDSYMKARKRTRLQFDDWAYLKTEWRKFTEAFINSNVHILICGRAGFEYDYFEDDAGRKQLEKTDIKMKAEGEMGYEPSLLVLMARETDMSTLQVNHVATVLKDRSDTLDGKKFTNPTFASFLPHIKLLNLGGKQLGVDASRTSEHMIVADKKDWQPVQRRIVIDEIQTLLVLHIPGQGAADKQRKAQLIRKHFNASWTEIEEVMALFDLRAGYDSLHQELEGKPSRYGQSAAPKVPTVEDVAAVARVEIDDALPDHSAPPANDDQPKSLKARLLADIPNLKSVADCLHWGLEMSPQAGGLSKNDMSEVRNALMARQASFMNGSGAHVSA